MAENVRRGRRDGCRSAPTATGRSATRSSWPTPNRSSGRCASSSNSSGTARCSTTKVAVDAVIAATRSPPTSGCCCHRRVVCATGAGTCRAGRRRLRSDRRRSAPRARLRPRDGSAVAARMALVPHAHRRRRGKPGVDAGAGGERGPCPAADPAAMTAVPSGTPELRRYEAADEPAVLVLLGASLGWVPNEPHARLFAWKHAENSFGVSPARVATVDGEVVGFRDASSAGSSGSTGSSCAPCGPSTRPRTRTIEVEGCSPLSPSTPSAPSVTTEWRSCSTRPTSAAAPGTCGWAGARSASSPCSPASCSLTALPRLARARFPPTSGRSLWMRASRLPTRARCRPGRPRRPAR